MLIEGNADNGGAAIANGFTRPYQKMRAGLGLLTDAGGNKAVVVSFSINGEKPFGPGHGFVVAYDVAASIATPGSRRRRPSGMSPRRRRRRDLDVGLRACD